MKNRLGNKLTSFITAAAIMASVAVMPVSVMAFEAPQPDTGAVGEISNGGEWSIYASKIGWNRISVNNNGLDDKSEDGTVEVTGSAAISAAFQFDLATKTSNTAAENKVIKSAKLRLTPTVSKTNTKQMVYTINNEFNTTDGKIPVAEFTVPRGTSDDLVKDTNILDMPSSSDISSYPEALSNLQTAIDITGDAAVSQDKLSLLVQYSSGTNTKTTYATSNVANTTTLTNVSLLYDNGSTDYSKWVYPQIVFEYSDKDIYKNAYADFVRVNEVLSEGVVTETTGINPGESESGSTIQLEMYNSDPKPIKVDGTSLVYNDEYAGNEDGALVRLTVTNTAEDGETASYTRVISVPAEYTPSNTISFDASKNPKGEISVISGGKTYTDGTAYAKAGGTFTVSDGANTGYTATVTVTKEGDDAEVISQNDDGSYTMPDGNVAVSVTYDKETYGTTRIAATNSISIKSDGNIQGNSSSAPNLVIGSGRITFVKFDLSDYNADVLSESEIRFNAWNTANTKAVFYVPNNNWDENNIDKNFMLDGTTGTSLSAFVYQDGTISLLNGTDVGALIIPEEDVSSAANGILKDYYVGSTGTSKTASFSVTEAVKTALSKSSDGIITLMIYSTGGGNDASSVLFADSLINRPSLTISESSAALPDEELITEINSVQDLAAFAEIVNGGNSYEGKTVTLADDLDLSEVYSTETGKSWTPIGTYDIGGIKPFAGTFEGGNHSITGLYINNDGSNQGLFGIVEGEVKNLTVAGEIKASSVVGGIAGSCSGNITNCSSGVNITAQREAGGITGTISAGGIIYGCDNTGNVTIQNKETYAGGIAGHNIDGVIDNCTNTGKIENDSDGFRNKIGGITGFLDNGEIRNSQNQGDVVSNAELASYTADESQNYVGGIIGYGTYGTVTNCSNSGNVYNVVDYAGGIAGMLQSGNTVSGCTNSGSVSGKDNVGGIAGCNYSSITGCRNDGAVSGKGTYVGGVVGYLAMGNLHNCSYDETLNSDLEIVGYNADGTITSDTSDEPSLIDLSNAAISGSESYQGKNGYQNAVDGDTSTFFDGLINGCCQINLRQNYNITQIRFYPRGGRSSDKPAEYVKRLVGGVFSGSLDGETWTEIYTIPSSIYTNDTDSSTVKWYEVPVNAEYKYIKYENNQIEANIAEIELYGIPVGSGLDPTPDPSTPTPEPEDPPVEDGFVLLDRTDWTAESNSVQDTRSTGAERVLDGNTATIWHSKNNPTELGSDKDTNPIYLMVDMGKTESVSMVRYTPREKGTAAGDINGVITDYELYAYIDQIKPGTTQIVIGEPEQSDDTTTVSVSVANPTLETESGVLFAAAYDSSSVCRQIKFVENGKADFDRFDTVYIKAFLWNSISGENSMVPLLDSAIMNVTGSWVKIAEGNLGYTANGVQLSRDIVFSPVETRYLKLVVKDNLCNTSTYLASCAEFNAYKYEGDMAEHPITAEKARIDEMITNLETIETDSEVKIKLLEKANELKSSGSVDAIENFMSTTPSVVDALSWIDKGIDDVYIDRMMTYLTKEDVSTVSLASVNNELSPFYKTGAEVADNLSDIWQNEFTMSEEEKTQPLYERIENAVKRAKARIDSGDVKDYKMLKELVSYLSGKNEYEGYENAYGMDAESCEAIVNNINFTLSNLEKMDNGELLTELTEFKSGEMWLDDKGSKISANGGQIIKQGDTYYWYGEDNKISYDLKTGVSCYSSTDLKNWTYEGLAFKVFDDGTEEKQFTKEFLTDSLEKTQGRIERPKVIYNKKNDNYVMWMHLEKDGLYDLSAMGVAVSESPTGPFVWKWYGRPVCDRFVINGSYHQFFRDMNLFVDDDKQAYLFVSSENNQVMYGIRLNDDYTWIDADDLESSGTTEEDITEGKVITPDMTIAEDRNGGYRGASYTYGKKSFTRYQLASGGAASLTKKKDADGNDAKDEDGNQIYVSTRSDGKLCIPEYADGRWARIGQYTAEENKEEDKTETIVNNDTTLSREAPAPIKIDDKYYMVTSALSGWKANPSLCQTTDNILGKWTKTGNPMTGDGPVNNGQWSQEANIQTSFNSQSTCIIQLPDGNYMYMGDRWKNGVYENSNGTFPDVDVKASTYVWLPITFETDNNYGENTLKVRWYDAWTYGGQTN